jgi:hypothetical protein
MVYSRPIVPDNIHIFGYLGILVGGFERHAIGGGDKGGACHALISIPSY